MAKCISFVFHHRSSAAEVRPEDAVEKVGQKKKKKIIEEYDEDSEDSKDDYEDKDDYDYVE